MKILYVSQYFPPEMGAPAGRAAELSRYWVRDGHEVTVLTGFPNHPTGEMPQRYRKQMHRLVSHEVVNGAKVVRSWLLPYPNRKAFERILNYGSFCASASMTGSFLSCPDLVIATSPQLLVGLAGWWIARYKHVPFIFEVRDLWPESLAAVGAGGEDSALYRMLGRVANFLYRRADHIVVVSPAFQTHLVEHWGIPAEKISVIENGVETDLFHPETEISSVRDCMDVSNDNFVVSYIGTIGVAHGLDLLLDAAECLQSQRPDIVFALIGEGADKARVMDMIDRRQLSNIRVLAQQPREKIPCFISASDACLVLLKNSPVFRTVIPTKMLEFMSCARPVILGVEGQARTILQQAEAGLSIRPENTADLLAAIVQLADDRTLCGRLGRNGRKYIIERFSRERTARSYEALLQSLLRKERLHEAAAA